MSRHPVDNYAHTAAHRYDRALDVHIAHHVTHGDAGDAVRGADGHSADWSGEYDPHTPAQAGRDAQSDLRGAARDARAHRGQ